MTDTPHDLVAVEQLLAERDALHGWLTRLVQASVDAPETVRDRVRRDYEYRLEQITNGLRAHADTIAAKLRDDQAEFATLSARANGTRDALAEAELRHAVGEFESSRFEAERTRYASDLETFELSLVAAAERIGRLEEVHGLVTRAPRVSPDELPVEEPAAALDVVAEVEDPIAIADLAPDGEAEQLLAVFEEPHTESPPSPAATPAPSDMGPLSFRPRGGSGSELARPAAPPSRSSRPVESVVSIGIPAAGVPPQFIRPGERLKAEPLPSDALFGEDIVASGPTPEAVSVPVGRTLRCGECGAMNRPLEWYCEKCGAELTAV